MKKTQKSINLVIRKWDLGRRKRSRNRKIEKTEQRKGLTNWKFAERTRLICKGLRKYTHENPKQQ